MNKNRRRRKKYLEAHFFTTKGIIQLLQNSWQRDISNNPLNQIQKSSNLHMPTVYLHVTNTIKAGRLYIQMPNLKPSWYLKLHKQNYVPFIFKELSQQMVIHFKKLIRRRRCSRVHVLVTRRPGFIKFPTRSLLWALRRAHPRHHITQVKIWLPRAHGQRTFKKVARRKKTLQRLRARIQRHTS